MRFNGLPLADNVSSPSQIRLRHLFVTRQAEQESYVDIDPFPDQLLDGRQSFACARNFDQQVRSVHRSPEMTGLGYCPRCVMSQLGRHLQADKTVSTFQPVINGTEEISSTLDIFYRERFVYLFNAFAL